MLDPTSSLVALACPCCGDLELRPSALHVTVFNPSAVHQVRFFCPSCTDEIVMPLTVTASDFLIRTLGVGFDEAVVPAEFLEDKSGPPLTSDDVLDFCLALRGVDIRFASDLPEELRVAW
jgi:predicted RNA-binding Zn-ribbon protein involved in translation (DUF1610 family)